MSNTRLEHDLLGDAPVPAQAYWGVHTLRAIENYPITGKPIGSYPELVRALALINRRLRLHTRNWDSSMRRAQTPSLPPARRSLAASCTTSSWWTSSRAAPVPRPT